MNDVMRIIRINGHIQHGLGKITLFGKEVLCVALDGHCTFASDSKDEDALELNDIQLDDIYNQTYGFAPVFDIETRALLAGTKETSS